MEVKTPKVVGFKALLVDDEPAIREVLSQVLEDGGFESVSAHSGEEAIDILQSESFDVIITDICMPGISGFELIERIATIDTAVKTVVITGFDSYEMIKQAINTGAYDYLTKPIDDHELVIQRAHRAAQATSLIRDNAELVQKLRENQAMLEAANQQLHLLNQELQVQANTDVLTDLYNRRYLEKTLYKEVSRRNRYSDSLSIALIDVDHFKAINDTHGHSGGDTVLKIISAALKDCVRESDVVGRYGGEEFLVILPNTSPESAMLFAERIRSSINERKIVLNDIECQVAISIGISGVESRFPELDVTNLVTSADQALYAAKGAGRNCIRSHPVATGGYDFLEACSGY